MPTNVDHKVVLDECVLVGGYLLVGVCCAAIELRQHRDAIRRICAGVIRPSVSSDCHRSARVFPLPSRVTASRAHGHHPRTVTTAIASLRAETPALGGSHSALRDARRRRLARRRTAAGHAGRTDGHVERAVSAIEGKWRAETTDRLPALCHKRKARPRECHESREVCQANHASVEIIHSNTPSSYLLLPLLPPPLRTSAPLFHTKAPLG